MLPDDERELIDRLFFQSQTEREAVADMGIYHNAVHKRKNRILGKLKKFGKILILGCTKRSSNVEVSRREFFLPSVR